MPKNSTYLLRVPRSEWLRFRKALEATGYSAVFVIRRLMADYVAAAPRGGIKAGIKTRWGWPEVFPRNRAWPPEAPAPPRKEPGAGPEAARE